MEYLTPSALLGLDVGCPDDFAPLLGFVGEKLAELGWREGSRRAAQVGKARLDFGIGEGGGDLLVESIDDFRGRVSRRADAEPIAGLEARHKFVHGRDVRQRLRASSSRDPQAPNPPGPDILDPSADPP